MDNPFLERSFCSKLLIDMDGILIPYDFREPFYIVRRNESFPLEPIAFLK